MAQLLTVRLNKSSQEPLGFRLQGGKDFGTPLAVQKKKFPFLYQHLKKFKRDEAWFREMKEVNGGSPAERAGLQAGDALIRVNNTDVFTLRHQEAQDAIRTSGSTLELTVQRGGGTWRPAVTPTGSLPRPGSRLGSTPTPVTSTSLKANQQPSRAFGSGHNNVAKPFGYMNGDNKSQIVNKQYNTPVNMYSDQTIAETLSAQTEVLAGGVLGVNFKKNEKTYDAEKSAVFKVLQEEQNDPEPERESGAGVPPPAVTGLRHVTAPVTRPDAPLNNTGGLPVGQNICEECERLITGVFVRIKDKNLHVECFKCATCGSSLKNQGYYNLNGKLYCDIHAKLVARNNPPAPNLEPVTVPPGGRIPTNAYSTPLPPLSTNNYTNGSSSMFSPSSNLSGPKPFGSSLGSAYSPSLSPRSAPLSPARPAYAPAPAPAYAPAPTPAYTPAPAPAYAPAPAPAYAPPAPAPAPVAPFAPTNETQFVNAHVPQKPDFKSPAEERLIRKMAKMALNGYEIGIQRKIKPADHIQSMADRIQDTVVMKHPLNMDEGSSGDSSRENTLRKPSNKPLERGTKPADSIQNIGEKIKNTILSKHPMAATYGNGNTVVPPQGFVSSSPIPPSQVAAPPPPPPIPAAPTPTNNVSSSPPPPPIPSTPIPTANVHSTPVAHKFINGKNKNNNHVQDEITLNLTLENPKNINKTTPINGKQHSSYDNSVDVKTEDTYKRRNNLFERSPFLNETLKSHDTYEPDNKFNNNYSNTLNKRNIFEKKDTIMDTKNCSDTKRCDKLNLYSNDSNIYNSTPKMFSKSDYETVSKTNSTEDLKIKSPLASNLYDNTLYDYKPILSGINGTNGNGYKSDDNIKEHKNNKLNGEQKDETDSDVIVKRREKTSERNNDGRRDSHIIARPLSTMTSTDSADGVYICNVCDKSITRGPFITALGRIWCPEHFICVNATCRRALQDIGFVEENGQLYCEYCFEQYIAPACNKCHGKIKGDCLNAIGKHFHPECFNCVYCGKLFGNNPFFLEDGLPYCEADWNELFTTKCFACGFPVEAGDRWVEALNNNYHSQCFNCTVCKKNLEGQSFFAKGGRPFCKLHAR